MKTCNQCGRKCAGCDLENGICPICQSEDEPSLVVGPSVVNGVYVVHLRGEYVGSFDVFDPDCMSDRAVDSLASMAAHSCMDRREG